MKFNVAVNRYAGGEKTANFFPVEVYGASLNDDVRSSLTKGHCVYIEGYYKTDEYMDKNGQKQYRDIIVANSIHTKTKGNFAIAVIRGIMMADPRVRTTPSGKNVTEFRVGAAHNYFSKKTNSWTNNPAYIYVYAWEPLGEFLAKNFKQDSGIFVVGELVMNQYTAKDGTKRTAYRVKAVTADFMNDAVDGQTAAPAQPAQAAPAAAPAAPAAPTAQPTYGNYTGDDFADIDDEDLPF